MKRLTKTPIAIAFLLCMGLSTQSMASSNTSNTALEATHTGHFAFRIHPRNVNALIGMASQYLEVSHGCARRMYRNGRITISTVEINNESYFDVSLDGMCILLVLEDSL